MTVEPQALGSGRWSAVDRLRGLAILLMLVDHALVQLDAGNPLRLTLTRFSLPLFMICAGLMLSERRGAVNWKRLGVTVACGIVVALPSWFVGLSPLLLLTIAAGLACGPWLVRWPSLWLVCGLIQALFVPLVGARDYEPGLIVVLLALGVLVARSADDWTRWSRWGGELPRWLGFLGRHALAVYVGHVAALLCWWLLFAR